MSRKTTTKKIDKKSWPVRVVTLALMAHNSTTIYPYGTLTAQGLGPRSNHYSLVRPEKNNKLNRTELTEKNIVLPLKIKFKNFRCFMFILQKFINL